MLKDCFCKDKHLAWLDHRAEILHGVKLLKHMLVEPPVLAHIPL